MPHEQWMCLGKKGHTHITLGNNLIPISVHNNTLPLAMRPSQTREGLSPCVTANSYGMMPSHVRTRLLNARAQSNHTHINNDVIALAMDFCIAVIVILK